MIKVYIPKKTYYPLKAYIAPAILDENGAYKDTCVGGTIIGPYKLTRYALNYAQKTANKEQREYFIGFYSDSRQLYSDNFPMACIVYPDILEDK